MAGKLNRIAAKFLLIITACFGLAILWSVFGLALRQDVVLASYGIGSVTDIFGDLQIEPQNIASNLLGGLGFVGEKAAIGKASLSSFLNDFGKSASNLFSGFFGGKKTANEIVTPKKDQVQPKENNTVSSNLPSASVSGAVKNIVSANAGTPTPENNLVAENPVAVGNSPAPAVQNIYNNYNPVREVIRTNTITEKIIQQDDSLAKRIDEITRQLDSDRPHFSLGQSFTMPLNLGGNNLSIGAGNFSVDSSLPINSAVRIKRASLFVMPTRMTSCQ